MSTSVKTTGIKSISPKKKKGKKRDRQQSISNSEFESFFNAFKQHSIVNKKSWVVESITSTGKCDSQTFTEAYT